MAEAALPNIIPKIRMAMISLSRTETAMITARISAAPTHADPTTPILRNVSEATETPNSGAPSKKSETPRLAPELIPNTYGPASGFRKRVCICKPLAESAAPTIRAVMAFGRRKWVTSMRV